MMRIPRPVANLVTACAFTRAVRTRGVGHVDARGRTLTPTDVGHMRAGCVRLEAWARRHANAARRLA